ncbi:MAG: transaldolase [Deltaproteobacteria bacterium]|nr:transaldolase [Deltaproteobacteria bacterium]
MGCRAEALLGLGQSVWFDSLGRGLIVSGELARLRDEEGVVGVTSNPTIFEKSIREGKEYAEEIARLAAAGASATEIYEALAFGDIRAACDVLRPVYERTRGVDGVVSIEVSPHLAHDTAGTIAEARSFWGRIGRDNLYIKVPATPEGVPAIRALIADGISVNVTLIFSVEAYGDVMRAYIDGLEARAARGLPLSGVRSVASFFVSRVDSVIDKRLAEIAAKATSAAEKARAEAQVGIAAVANARIAYARFKGVFSGARWEALAAKGARVQRPLWASTGTKNAAYSDVKYVDDLVARDTVNTMPPATLKAFNEHGRVALAEMDACGNIVGDLAALGISTDAVCAELLKDGVRLFAESFDKLIQGIDEKRRAVKSDVVTRVRQKDATLWKSAPDAVSAITNRLGWVSCVPWARERAGELKSFAADVRGAGFTDAVVLGMGGSSLAAEVFWQTFRENANGLRLHVLDTTCPEAIRATERRIDAKRTLFVVASKSGTTIEVDALWRYFWERTSMRGDAFVAITDAGTPLERLAKENGFRRIFVNPGDIGGRYSALSYFGLVPAALAGVDVSALLGRVREDDGALLGSFIGRQATMLRDKLTLVLSPALSALGLWIEQLVAESLGKEGRGVVPVDGELLGEPAGNGGVRPPCPSGSPFRSHGEATGFSADCSRNYGADRCFVSVRTIGEVEPSALKTLESAGFPVMRRVIADALDLGAEFYAWEIATAVAAAALGVNPFDEPNVSEAKEVTWKVLSGEESATNGLDATELAASIRPADYVALLAYFQPSPDDASALGRLREKIRDATGAATTLGFGPRYLHSTGQLHKGGPANGVFIVLTASRADDLAIPGRPYTFGQLIDAQAAGDVATLIRHKRRVARVSLPAVGATRVREIEALALRFTKPAE